MDDILLEDVTLSFIRERKPIKLFKKLKSAHFSIEQKWHGIYYILKDGFIQIQIIVSKELDPKDHIWLNSLAEKSDLQRVTSLIKTTQKLEDLDDKNYADSLWEIVASVNKQLIQKMREDKTMCKALAEIMKPEIDEAFDNGFNNGFGSGFDSGFNNGFDNGSTEKGIRIFKNMIKDGVPKELAQKYAEISDQLVEKALADLS